MSDHGDDTTHAPPVVEGDAAGVTAEQPPESNTLGDESENAAKAEESAAGSRPQTSQTNTTVESKEENDGSEESRFAWRLDYEDLELPELDHSCDKVPPIAVSMKSEDHRVRMAIVFDICRRTATRDKAEVYYYGKPFLKGVLEILAKSMMEDSRVIVVRYAARCIGQAWKHIPEARKEIEEIIVPVVKSLMNVPEPDRVLALTTALDELARWPPAALMRNRTYCDHLFKRYEDPNVPDRSVIIKLVMRSLMELTKNDDFGNECCRDAMPQVCALWQETKHGANPLASGMAVCILVQLMNAGSGRAPIDKCAVTLLDIIESEEELHDRAALAKILGMILKHYPAKPLLQAGARRRMAVMIKSNPDSALEMHCRSILDKVLKWVDNFHLRLLLKEGWNAYKVSSVMGKLKRRVDMLSSKNAFTWAMERMREGFEILKERRLKEEKAIEQYVVYTARLGFRIFHEECRELHIFRSNHAMQIQKIARGRIARKAYEAKKNAAGTIGIFWREKLQYFKDLGVLKHYILQCKFKGIFKLSSHAFKRRQKRLAMKLRNLMLLKKGWHRLSVNVGMMRKICTVDEHSVARAKYRFIVRLKCVLFYQKGRREKEDRADAQLIRHTMTAGLKHLHKKCVLRRLYKTLQKRKIHFCWRRFMKLRHEAAAKIQKFFRAYVIRRISGRWLQSSLAVTGAATASAPPSMFDTSLDTNNVVQDDGKMFRQWVIIDSLPQSIQTLDGSGHLTLNLVSGRDKVSDEFHVDIVKDMQFYSCPDCQRRLMKYVEDKEFMQAVESMWKTMHAMFKIHGMRNLEVLRRLEMMILFCNVFGIHLVETDDAVIAMTLFKNALSLIQMVTEEMHEHVFIDMEIWTSDNMSLYFYKVGKYNAALQYCTRVHKLLKALVQKEAAEMSHLSVALIQLHTGSILSRLNKHSEANECARAAQKQLRTLLGESYNQELENVSKGGEELSADVLRKYEMAEKKVKGAKKKQQSEMNIMASVMDYANKMSHSGAVGTKVSTHVQRMGECLISVCFHNVAVEKLLMYEYRDLLSLASRGLNVASRHLEPDHSYMKHLEDVRKIAKDPRNDTIKKRIKQLWPLWMPYMRFQKNMLHPPTTQSSDLPLHICLESSFKFAPLSQREDVLGKKRSSSKGQPDQSGTGMMSSLSQSASVMDSVQLDPPGEPSIVILEPIKPEQVSMPPTNTSEEGARWADPVVRPTMDRTASIQSLGSPNKSIPTLNRKLHKRLLNSPLLVSPVKVKGKKQLQKSGLSKSMDGPLPHDVRWM